MPRLATANKSFSTSDVVLDGLVQSSPDRKSRTWRKAVDKAADGNVAHGTGGGTGSGSGSGGVDSGSGGGSSETPAATAGAATVQPDSGGVGPGSTFLSSAGVWKKACAVAANATATATATAKAVNHEVSATATAAAAGLAATGGIPWVGSMGNWIGSSGGDPDVGGGQEEEAEGKGHKDKGLEQEDNGKKEEEEEEDEEQQGEGEEPAFLTISVGDVSCFLPDVHWSVQMHQKRFLRVGDSGSVK